MQVRFEKAHVERFADAESEAIDGHETEEIDGVGKEDDDAERRAESDQQRAIVSEETPREQPMQRFAFPDRSGVRERREKRQYGSDPPDRRQAHDDRE